LDRLQPCKKVQGHQEGKKKHKIPMYMEGPKTGENWEKMGKKNARAEPNSH
jgi:hypothetical protein